MTAASHAWYRIVIGDRVVAASGEHLGAAVAAAEAHGGAHAVAAEPMTGADAVPLGDAVGKQRVIELEKSEATGARWSLGVVPKHAASPALGYARTAAGTLTVIEAQVEADATGEVFLSLLERLPAADNLEVRVLDHYDGAAAATAVWLTARVDAKRILRFLDDHDELIANGHVELSIYVRVKRATLRLSEHKTIVWLAEDGALCSDVERWLGELGVAPLAELATIADIPHLHYRPAKSRDRSKLEEHLYRQRLRKVATIDEP